MPGARWPWVRLVQLVPAVLGCLRALDDSGLLGAVTVVSGISGGALLAALWAYGPTEFAQFDAAATKLLRGGLQQHIVAAALAPSSWGRAATSSARALLLGGRDAPMRTWNRTEAFARMLDRRHFAGRQLARPTHPGLAVVLTATDLRSGAAVRFGSTASSCSRYGRITEEVSIGTAVAASAAYPLLLPTLERRFTFDRRGETRSQTVLLSDGGLLDNLGLAVLAPGRSPAHTDHVYDVDYLVACDAGRGPLAPRTPRFLLRRTGRAFEVTHSFTQNQGRSRLHEWGNARSFDGFVMAYLGMRDDKLPVPIADLVPRDAVASYPTNFAAVPDEAFDRLTVRGEQLVRALLPVYAPNLLR